MSLVPPLTQCFVCLESVRLYYRCVSGFPCILLHSYELWVQKCGTARWNVLEICYVFHPGNLKSLWLPYWSPVLRLLRQSYVQMPSFDSFDWHLNNDWLFSAGTSTGALCNRCHLLEPHCSVVSSLKNQNYKRDGPDGAINMPLVSKISIQGVGPFYCFVFRRIFSNMGAGMWPCGEGHSLEIHHMFVMGIKSYKYVIGRKEI